MWILSVRMWFPLLIMQPSSATSSWMLKMCTGNHVSWKNSFRCGVMGKNQTSSLQENQCISHVPKNQLREQMKVQRARFKTIRKNWIFMQQVAGWWNTCTKCCGHWKVPQVQGQAGQAHGGKFHWGSLNTEKLLTAQEAPGLKTGNERDERMLGKVIVLPCT